MTKRTTRRGLGCAAGALALAALSAPAAHGDRRGLHGIASDLALSELATEIETTNERQEQLAVERERLAASERALHANLQGRVRALYRLTRDGVTPVNGGFDALRTHVARIRRLRALVASDALAWNDVEARDRAARAETELNGASLLHARERLQALQNEAAQEERSEAFEPAKPRRTFPQPESDADHGFYGLRLSNEPPRSTFESQRGKLAMPVSGEVRVADLQRSAAEGPALAFEAPAGTPVRAAAPGRVAFNDAHGEEGRQVILDHGGGYYTAYGGLGSVEVRVGDEVSARARIGEIGRGGQTSALSFEVKQGTRALPPRPWLGL